MDWFLYDKVLCHERVMSVRTSESVAEALRDLIKKKCRNFCAMSQTVGDFQTIFVFYVICGTYSQQVIWERVKLRGD